jgi:hypothetical protein
MMGVSYYKAGQDRLLLTDWEEKTMGDSWVIPLIFDIAICSNPTLPITQESPIVFFSQSVVTLPCLVVMIVEGSTQC